MRILAVTNVPQRHIDRRKVVVFVGYFLESGIKGIGHDLQSSFDAGDDEIDIITRAFFGAHGLSILSRQEANQGQ